MKNEEQGTPQRKPTAAFALSLLAGLWMLVSSAGTAGRHRMMEHGFEGMHMWMWRHDYVHGLMTAQMWSWIGVPLAALICIAALIIYVRPRAHPAWSIIIIACSILAAATGAGFVPSILGILGGFLGATWRTNTAS